MEPSESAAGENTDDKKLKKESSISETQNSSSVSETSESQSKLVFGLQELPKGEALKNYKNTYFFIDDQLYHFNGTKNDKAKFAKRITIRDPDPDADLTSDSGLEKIKKVLDEIARKSQIDLSRVSKENPSVVNLADDDLNSIKNYIQAPVQIREPVSCNLFLGLKTKPNEDLEHYKNAYLLIENHENNNQIELYYCNLSGNITLITIKDEKAFRETLKNIKDIKSGKVSGTAQNEITNLELTSTNVRDLVTNNTSLSSEQQGHKPDFESVPDRNRRLKDLKTKKESAEKTATLLQQESQLVALNEAVKKKQEEQQAEIEKLKAFLNKSGSSALISEHGTSELLNVGSIGPSFILNSLIAIGENQKSKDHLSFLRLAQLFAQANGSSITEKPNEGSKSEKLAAAADQPNDDYTSNQTSALPAAAANKSQIELANLDTILLAATPPEVNQENETITSTLPNVDSSSGLLPLPFSENNNTNNNQNEGSTNSLAAFEDEYTSNEISALPAAATVSESNKEPILRVNTGQQTRTSTSASNQGTSPDNIQKQLKLKGELNKLTMNNDDQTTLSLIPSTQPKAATNQSVQIEFRAYNELQKYCNNNKLECAPIDYPKETKTTILQNNNKIMQVNIPNEVKSNPKSLPANPTNEDYAKQAELMVGALLSMMTDDEKKEKKTVYIGGKDMQLCQALSKAAKELGLEVQLAEGLVDALSDNDNNTQSHHP